MLWWSTAHGKDMTTEKKTVALWYEAFSTKDAAILDRILAESWVDIPGPPDQAPGPAEDL